MRYFVLLLIVLAAAAVYAVTRFRNSRNVQKRKNNVIPLDAHRRARQHSEEQPCSSCKKKNGKLIFYAQDDGTVTGLCKDCRDKAKKRDMLPL